MFCRLITKENQKATFKEFRPEAEKLGLSFIPPLEGTPYNQDPEMHVEEELLDISYDSFRFTNTEPGYYLFAACILDYAENCHMTYSDIIDTEKLPQAAGPVNTVIA